jgi:hypothetical protein
MPPFKKKYAGERRQAMFKAHFDDEITYSEISRMAAAGQLIPGDSFTIPPQYVGELCRAERERRAGQFVTPLAAMPHRDAVEELRRRALGIADYLSTDAMAIARKTPAKLDVKRAQELAKLVTFVSTIPARNEDAPLAPGKTVDGKRPSGEKIRGRMGALLAAAQAEAQNGEGPPDDGPSAGHGQDVAAS